MLQFGDYPLYNVDASALIDANECYPGQVFPSMWHFVGDLVTQSRLLICEEVNGECDYPPELRKFIEDHPGMVVSFEHMQHYFRRFQFEAHKHGLQLVDPSSTKDKADPYVVALALMLERREPQDLRKNRPGCEMRGCVP